MKNILPMLLLTVMLRVWWNGHVSGLGKPVEAGDGIFLYMAGGIFPDGPMWQVRTDKGRMMTIFAKNVYKTKWVEVKAEK